MGEAGRRFIKLKPPMYFKLSKNRGYYESTAMSDADQKCYSFKNDANTCGTTEGLRLVECSWYSNPS